MTPTTCADCQTPMRPRGRRDLPGKTASGRGLCEGCYNRHRYHGTLIDFERTRYRGVDLLNEWAALHRDGYDRNGAAARLGIKRNTLDQAIARSKRQAVTS